jgi:general secretion pathway protein K
VRVRVQDEAGRIDLNLAQEELLIRLLISVGVAPDAARALVECILDWREPGIGKRLNGAKANEYHDAGLSYGPRNGPFEAVEELRLVLGMTRPLFDLLAPALTVYSQTPWVDVDVAPEQVLRVLVDERRIGGILEARRGEATEDGTARAPAAASPAVKLGHTFTITAEVAGPAPLRAEKRAAVRLTGYRKPAILVYRWN